MFPCVYCYDDPEEDNQDEINDNFKLEIQNLFL
jgi:hypothetical protein